MKVVTIIIKDKVGTILSSKSLYDSSLEIIQNNDNELTVIIKSDEFLITEWRTDVLPSTYTERLMNPASCSNLPVLCVLLRRSLPAKSTNDIRPRNMNPSTWSSPNMPSFLFLLAASLAASSSEAADSM